MEPSESPVLSANQLRDSARGMRKFLATACWVHCVVDLTAVRVFEDSGVYTILLIFQKWSEREVKPVAKIAKCQDRVAQALQDVLDNRVVQTPFYTIHEAYQDAFKQDEWFLASPSVALILNKYAEMGELSSEAHLRQGMNTGADDIFIIPKEALKQVESEAFVPLLSDREMESYTVPENVDSFVFYPYKGDQLLAEDTLRSNFPKTWAFLEEHRGTLQERSGVKKEVLAWWKPERSREPKNMLRPKIVSPHVVITPRFGLDGHGRYAISRAPMIFSKFIKAGERDHLLYLLGILNSTACFWHISQRAHVYERGYSRLELSRLRGTRIPTFSSVDKGAARKLIRAVDARLKSQGKFAFELEAEIDELVNDLYNLTPSQREMISGSRRGESNGV